MWGKMVKKKKICYGQRAGVSLPHGESDAGSGGGGVSTAILAAGFEYKYVEGAALFAGLTLDTLTFLLATKAGAPNEPIGLVLVLPMGMPFQNDIKVKTDYLLGYTWCAGDV